LSLTALPSFALAQGFISLEPHNGAPWGGHYGWKVAHDQLIRAALRYSQATSIDLFSDPNSVLPAEVEALRTENGGNRIFLRVMEQLPLLAQDNNYIFLNAGYMSTQLAQVRRSLGLSFGICHLVHSIPASLPYALPWLLGLLLTSESTDVILASSSAGKRAVLNLLELGNDYISSRTGGQRTRRPTVIQAPLGVDTDFLKPLDRISCRHIMGLDESEIAILYVGRLSPTQKADLMPLLFIFGRLLREYPSLVMILAGETAGAAYGEDVRNAARRLGVAARLRIIPDFSYFSKPIIYSAADVFVSPVDNIQETFGLAVLEAMAMELPVVVPDWSGYRDLVEAGQTGFLIPTLWSRDAGEIANQLGPFWGESTNHFLAQRTSFDVDCCQRCLETLIRDGDLRCEMGKSGRRRAMSRFSWPAVIRALDEIWQEQAHQVSSREPTGNGSDIIDYNSTFGSFATEEFSASTCVIAADDANIVEAVLPVDVQAPYGIYPGEARHIIQHCTGRQECVGELLRRGVASQSSTVAWLLKEGYLKLARQNSTGAC
jgi:D-inositol-3-phosphate glycosyltransferase